MCVFVCVCVHTCVHVCVTNNRLQGNCRGLQWLWAGLRHHPSIWRWGWIQFDIPVCLCLHHYGPKLAGSDRLRGQVAWCRRGSLRLYFSMKSWMHKCVRCSFKMMFFLLCGQRIWYDSVVFYTKQHNFCANYFAHRGTCISVSLKILLQFELFHHTLP